MAQETGKTFQRKNLVKGKKYCPRVKAIKTNRKTSQGKICSSMSDRETV
jgi:hypothetical protein